MWATAATGETATGTVTLPAAGAASVYAWDYSATGASTTVTPSGGSASLALTATPQFFVRPVARTWSTHSVHERPKPPGPEACMKADAMLSAC